MSSIFSGSTRPSTFATNSLLSTWSSESSESSRPVRQMRFRATERISPESSQYESDYPPSRSGGARLVLNPSRSSDSRTVINEYNWFRQPPKPDFYENLELFKEIEDRFYAIPGTEKMKSFDDRVRVFVRASFEERDPLQRYPLGTAGNYWDDHVHNMFGKSLMHSVNWDKYELDHHLRWLMTESPSALARSFQGTWLNVESLVDWKVPGFWHIKTWFPTYSLVYAHVVNNNKFEYRIEDDRLWIKPRGDAPQLDSHSELLLLDYEAEDLESGVDKYFEIQDLKREGKISKDFFFLYRERQSLYPVPSTLAPLRPRVHPYDRRWSYLFEWKDSFATASREERNNIVLMRNREVKNELLRLNVTEFREDDDIYSCIPSRIEWPWEEDIFFACVSALCD